jgi:hypothetical protein
MSAYEDDADRMAEHIYPCDDPYCQICHDEELRLERAERQIERQRELS